MQLLGNHLACVDHRTRCRDARQEIRWPGCHGSRTLRGRDQPVLLDRRPTIRIALIAPPFIPVPPLRYGGTELFIATLAEGLRDLGHEVVVYANGESQVGTEVRWLYPKTHWPITGDPSEPLKEMIHSEWAIRDAARTCDVIQTSSVYALPHSKFVPVPFVHTIHHEHVDTLSDFYKHYPEINYVTISDFQRRQEKMPHIRTIQHGIDLSQYKCGTTPRKYLSFLGRIAPIKGTHLAIEVAKRSGIPLKIAGEIQPIFLDYFKAEIEPHLDGKFIEYIGEVGLQEKNELLCNSIAMLFPIQWNEPFGLVMIEAMACGAPVLAFPGGSVPEVVRDGVSGYVCNSVDDMAQRALAMQDEIVPQLVRDYAERRFSREEMAAAYDRLFAAITRKARVETATELLRALPQSSEAA